MDLMVLLTAIAVIIPLVCACMLWANSGSMSERHHSHHDTYQITSTLTFSIVFAMIIMSVLAMLLERLCVIGVFRADSSVTIGFFDGFLVVLFVYWLILRRYKVVTYNDRMLVTPFFGRTTEIRYADISAMEWTTSVLVRNSRNIRVFVGRRRRALLWAVLDLDQILVRINRFDVLDSLSS
ncbi:MAG: hypothetical protein Q4A01_09335 [Coriobacteriales bacterium]|nr:hypothetical protein [Coriobacteriales bacterium]